MDGNRKKLIGWMAAVGVIGLIGWWEWRKVEQPPKEVNMAELRERVKKFSPPKINQIAGIKDDLFGLDQYGDLWILDMSKGDAVWVPLQVTMMGSR